MRCSLRRYGLRVIGKLKFQARRLAGAAGRRAQSNEVIGTEDLKARVAARIGRSESDGPEPTFTNPISQACTFAQLEHPNYHRWRKRLKEPTVYNRKVWEWAWICEMFEQSGRADMELVGFGVGTEPIVGWLAGLGHSILATDLPEDDGAAQRWATTNQHAAGIEGLDPRHIASRDVLAQRVRHRPVDMRDVPRDLGTFDGMWSSCAIEHLGDLRAGFDFVLNSLQHCRPGGLALHTTELNVSHYEQTVESGHTVVYRQRDLEEFFDELRALGHRVEATFNLGTHDRDLEIDWPPFSNYHLKIPVDGVVATSFGIAIHVG